MMNNKIKFLIAVMGITIFLSGCSNPHTTIPYVSKVWVADNGDGTYKNPVLYADYSDPDIERVGNDYYMTASSFSSIPCLPVLHSRDLVNWSIIGHALPKYDDRFNNPQPGNGVWAPAIRYQKNYFYIYWGDPDIGILMVKSKNPAGPWDKPILVLAGKGLIDPCPFWDDDGNAYLVHAWAKSRAGFNGILTVHKMNAEGTKADPQRKDVFNGNDTNNPTIEGPKFYKQNGFYYIFAPAGGVKNGWQLALRSKYVYGPYEYKIVMDQGSTNINGPHQGGWVETPSGQFWFIHFQDKGPYGRVVHLEPMQWINDWPVIGIDEDKDKGQPVNKFAKPKTKKFYPIITPAESDEFNSSSLGLQWQWQANTQSNWYALNKNTGLRLYAINQIEEPNNLSLVPNILLQKFPAPDFAATTKVKLSPNTDNICAGLIIMGSDYASIYIAKRNKEFFISQSIYTNALQAGKEQIIQERPLQSDSIYLRIKVSSPDAKCQFSYSTDGNKFESLGKQFTAKPGKWIGAKISLFAVSPANSQPGGYADFDWFHIE